ncbi:hypothetical protein [Methylomonas sp. 11b]|uniref:hypothetical protein n=1 Tax=Methylomonas sp. 11b TaxID=1168169 RepID=UPI0004786BE8|nr:hypothetical protein [Methylomonas sp. 11b]
MVFCQAAPLSLAASVQSGILLIPWIPAFAGNIYLHTAAFRFACRAPWRITDKLFGKRQGFSRWQIIFYLFNSALCVLGGGILIAKQESPVQAGLTWQPGLAGILY